MARSTDGLVRDARPRGAGGLRLGREAALILRLLAAAAVSGGGAAQVAAAAPPPQAPTAPPAAAPGAIPLAPRFPLGRPDGNSPPWPKLAGACNGTRLRDVGPCLRGFVDQGSVLGFVTLVDRRGLGVQVDAAGIYRQDSIFQIMSMTKPFVGAAVLQLVERGLIPSVDHRVRELKGFSDFPHPDMTLRQLLTHTSRLWPKQRANNGPAVGIAPHLTNRFDRQPEVTVRDKPLAFVAQHYLDATRYPLSSIDTAYSNIGYTVLGWIVERVSGVPFDRYVQDNILTPLGMSDTFFFPDRATAAQRARIARLDRRLPDPPDYAHYDETRPGWVYASPEGGLYSTATDLQRFLELFRHRGQVPGRPRVLGEASVAVLMTDQVPGKDRGCGGKVGWSLAFSLVRSECPDLPGLRPGTIRLAGRFSTDFWYDPERDEIGVFLYQAVGQPEGTPSLAENDAFKQLLARLTGP